MTTISKKTFIIAEVGINHNGSFEIAKQMIDEAKYAKADAVKFQTFKAEGVTTVKKDIEKLKKLELTNDEFIKMKQYCDKKKIMFLSTPHSEDAIDFLEPLVPMYKIASGDLTNHKFLKKIAKKGKPIILGTGMADLSEVKEAVKTISLYNNDITLLHCTTQYPCPLSEVNLKAMITMKDFFGLPVGYSDHTHDVLPSIVAVGLGATVIEKHFTLDRNQKGCDHSSSLEPEEFKYMVRQIRDVEKILGSSIKQPTKYEIKIRDKVRKDPILGKRK